MKAEFTVALIASATLFQATEAVGAPILFIGADQGAQSFDEMLNSQSAAADFDTATGPLELIDFESPLPDDFSNAGGTIVDIDSGFALFGGNTTPGGDFYLDFSSTENLVFNFASPIDSFGAFFGGLQGEAVGQQFITYSDGDTVQIDVPLLSSGGAFIGFTQTGASISSIEFEFFNDIIGIDDIRYGVAAVTVPETPTLPLLVLGAMALGFTRRRAAPAR